MFSDYDGQNPFAAGLNNFGSNIAGSASGAFTPFATAAAINIQIQRTKQQIALENINSKIAAENT